jgi:hypothetical protein
MEDIIIDYLWFKYEGKIITDTWNKYIKWKGNSTTQKFLVDKLFRNQDLKRFYQLGHIVSNLAPILEESWINKELLIDRYYYILENSEDTYIDLLLIEYHIWLFYSNVKEYKKFLNILEK